MISANISAGDKATPQTVVLTFNIAGAAIGSISINSNGDTPTINRPTSVYHIGCQMETNRSGFDYCRVWVDYAPLDG